MLFHEKWRRWSQTPIKTKIINKVSSNLFKYVLRHGRYLLAFAILFFLIKHLFVLLQDLNVESISFSPLLLLTSYVVLFVYHLVYIVPWLTIYQNTTSESISFLSGWTLVHLSDPGKYLPGKVGQFVGMAALCRSLNILRNEAIVSTLIHLAIRCLMGCFVGILFIFSPESREYLLNILSNFWHNTFRFSAIIVVIIALGVIFLIVFKNRFSSKIPYLKKVIKAIHSFKKLFRLIVIHLLLWACAGVSFFLFLRSIYPIRIVQLPIISSIYSLAWSLGFMSLITPSGLGVREGVLSLLLTSCLPPATATLVALLSRLWLIGWEIVLAGVAFGCYIRQKRINPNIQENN